MRAKTNINVITKPELTDEEIQSHMDFNKLLQTYRQGGPVNKIPKWVKISRVSIVFVTAVSTIAYFLNRNSSLSLDKGKPSQSVAIVDTTASINANKTPQLDSKKSNKKVDGALVKKEKPLPQKPQKKDSLAREKQPAPQFTEATPVDGYPSLYAYFDRELRYPIPPKDSIQGTVTVSFAITTAGKPDLIKVENSLGATFDAECIRVIQNMPPWTPATVNGKPIQTRLSIPLSFKIKK